MENSPEISPDKPKKVKPDKLGLPDITFQAIKSGQKQVEGRPFSNNTAYEQLVSGDEITFVNEDTGEELRTRVNAVHHYTDVRSMLEAEGIERVLRDPNDTIEIGIERYNSFKGYSTRIAEGGIFAIGIDPLPANNSESSK